VFFGLVRMKVDAARSKIATLIAAILLTSLFVSIPAPANAAACSPTETTASNGDTILTFSTLGNCNWEVPTGVGLLRTLVVGGGGAGGGYTANFFGNGGGGGEELDSPAVATPGEVIATKPSKSKKKNSATATVTGLKPGQKVKVTVNVKPRP
jgi:hypothetical protein